MINKLFIILSITAFVSSYIVNPGPKVIATKGEVWPKPQTTTTSNKFYIIRPKLFKFQTTNQDCPVLLQTAFTRYEEIIVNSNSLAKRGRFPEVGLRKLNEKYWLKNDKFRGYLDTLDVTITGTCSENEFPSLQSDENYTLSISESNNNLTSPTIWGILHGLETFSQLIYLQDELLPTINMTEITDFPRFSHRGLLLDTSRHFMPLYIIYEILDGMAYNKYNVFHWHIIDDHSFPYVSLSYPELSNKGAYHPVSKVYQQVDVQQVIEYARKRGIRVLVEIDTPGHTRSWGVAYPDLLTSCYENGEPTGQLGPMNPVPENTYSFIKTLFTELVSVFPDDYIHLGGDEVEFECWESNQEINDFMSKNNITTYAQLESYFIQKLLGIVDELNKKYMVWEEVFNNGVILPNDTIVHVWIGSDDPIKLSNITKSGKFALYSSCWYLDHLATGGDWEKYYACDPHDFDGTDEQKQRVIGGEACMWSETVNEYNVIPRIWPRASAAAEKLWSAATVTDVGDAQKRLEEHTCRMNYRGIAAQPPNGPGVCL